MLQTVSNKGACKQINTNRPNCASLSLFKLAFLWDRRWLWGSPAQIKEPLSRCGSPSVLTDIFLTAISHAWLSAAHAGAYTWCQHTEGRISGSLKPLISRYFFAPSYHQLFYPLFFFSIPLSFSLSLPLAIRICGYILKKKSDLHGLARKCTSWSKAINIKHGECTENCAKSNLNLSPFAPSRCLPSSLPSPSLPPESTSFRTACLFMLLLFSPQKLGNVN